MAKEKTKMMLETMETPVYGKMLIDLTQQAAIS